MPPSVTIQHVAEAAGVSPTTVSFVLNNRGNISDETRERVWHAVRSLGYTRSAAARNLRDNQSRVIGYALDKNRSRFNPVLDNFLYDVLRRCEAIGRHVMLFSHEPHTGVKSYRHLIESRQVDGFILSHTRQNDERFVYLQAEGIPFVAFGRSASHLDETAHWVDIDGFDGTHQATRHLLEQGFERIAFVGWPLGSVSGDARFLGYEQALIEHGVQPNPQWEVRVENDMIQGYTAAQRLFDLADTPDAIVAVSDAIALGILRCAHEQGLSIGVTGFDDTPLAELSMPALTSVRQPVDQVAALLVEMLLAQLEDRPVAEKHCLLKPELIIRASSQPYAVP